MTTQFFVLSIENIKEALDRNNISYFEVNDEVANKNELYIAASQNVTYCIEEHFVKDGATITAHQYSTIRRIGAAIHKIAETFEIGICDIHHFDLSYGPLNYLEDITPAAFFFQQ